MFSAALMSLAHGTNDAQKTMGVIFLALISYGAASKTDVTPPLWVIVSCAVAMAAGTYFGGWRVIRTLGKGLVEIESPRAWPPNHPRRPSFCCPVISATRCRPRRW